MHVALIDDDLAVLDSLALYLKRQAMMVTCFATADAFVARQQSPPFDCVVADVRMPGLSGIDLVRRFREEGRSTPVILITGHGDVDMAVTAIKVGAYDFIEKPFDEARLLSSIHNAIDKWQQPEIDSIELEKLQSRVNSLSTRQRQVMELAVAGLSNKEIGSKLKISPKTVENHRAWLMERIGARNIAELVRIAMKVQSRP